MASLLKAVRRTRDSVFVPGMSMCHLACNGRVALETADAGRQDLVPLRYVLQVR